MENYDEYYSALGLKPGATQKEIRSAYRRMVKQYHPDQDPSLHAEVQYSEARRAYYALRKLGAARLNFQQPRYTQNTDAKKSDAATSDDAYDSVWYYEYDDDNDDDDEFDFSDLMWEYGARKRIKERIPFSFEMLPKILLESIKEAAGFWTGFRVLIFVGMMKFVFFVLQWNSFVANGAVFCYLFGACLFRYYYPYDNGPSLMPNVLTRLLGSILHCVCFYFLIGSKSLPYKADVESIMFMVLFAFLAPFILWLRPSRLFASYKTHLKFEQDPWKNKYRF